MVEAFRQIYVFNRNLFQEFLENNCPHLAAAISFYAFFSLFPLVLAVVSVAGFVLGSRSLETQLTNEVGNLLPVSKSFVTETIRGVVRARGATGIAATIGLLWASTAVFGAVRKAVNAAWGIRRPRPFLHERLIDFGLMGGAGFLFILSISSTAILRLVRQELTIFASMPSPLNGDPFWTYVASVIPPLLTFLTFLALYRFLPNALVKWRDVWLGALIATAAFEVAKNVFVWYVQSFANYNVIYGSVGAVVALLTWAYISALIFLFGAGVAAQYHKVTNSKAPYAEADILPAA